MWWFVQQLSLLLPLPVWEGHAPQDPCGAGRTGDALQVEGTGSGGYVAPLLAQPVQGWRKTKPLHCLRTNGAQRRELAWPPGQAAAVSQLGELRQGIGGRRYVPLDWGRAGGRAEAGGAGWLQRGFRRHTPSPCPATI